MKKTLIAGAASVALAAMPVVGVFATAPINGSPIVDTLNITVSDACSFSRKVSAVPDTTPVEYDAGHPAGDVNGMTSAAWAEGTVAAGDLTGGKINNTTVAVGSDKDTFSASVVAGNDYDEFAKSAFNVTCNNATGGYKVTADAGNLVGAGSNIAYNAGEYASSGSSYFFTSEITDETPTAGSTIGTLPIVWRHETFGTDSAAKLASDNFEITYSLRVDASQAVGTYTGSVVYVLTNL